MKYELVNFEKSDEVVAAYDAGRCDVYTTDKSGLYAQRLKMKNPDDNIVLPETISQEPLGPVVRQGDVVWYDIVKWTHFAMLEAELYGVTKANVDEMKGSDNPKVRRLLGVEGEFGQAHRAEQRLGLQHHQERRKLRRDLREGRGHGLPAEDRARAERAVDQRRPAIRHAGSLTACGRPRHPAGAVRI